MMHLFFIAEKAHLCDLPEVTSVLGSHLALRGYVILTSVFVILC